jgi:PAS domain S-box-containing protein
LSAPKRPSGVPLDEPTFRILVNTVRDYAIFMLDPAGHILTWNAGAEAIKGYKPKEIIGSHFSRFYPPEALARKLPEHELKVAAEVGRFEDEGWRVRKDGSLFWANVIITALRDEQGRLIGYAKVTRDLTERRQQEERLKESEERSRALIGGVRDYAIFMLDPQGYVTTWNEGAQHIKGYEAHEIIGSHFSRFYPQESIQQGLPERELRGATLEGRFEDEGWRLRKDGSRFWANVVITAIRDAGGDLRGFSKITRDLTERREQENRLKESEERFRLLVEGVSEYAIFMLDRAGFVSSWNSGAQRIMGYNAAEIIGKHSAHLYPAEDIRENKPWRLLTAARESGRAADEGWRVRKDGSLFWGSSTLTAIKDSEGRHCGFAKVMQDLTERRHAESLADTAQRMHEFIAMLAHELRNPLAPIRNAVALMGRKGMPDPTLEAMRQMIDRQSVHLTRLLDELLDVNRIARGEFIVRKESVELADVLNRALETSRPLIDAQHHELHVKLPAQSTPLLGDPVRLTQVFVNILNNAAKYTSRGGQIWLSASINGADVEVCVRDTGRGIERDKLESVFDMFVQLAPPDAAAYTAHGGLGVGLALVRRIVELHGGHVRAHSEGVGRGSDFIVRLPLDIRHPKATPAVDSARNESAVRALRVMVVDDNQDAADSLSLLLQSLGQTVRTAYDGATALTIADAFNPDLVLLDIGMPQMSGYEVARKLADRMKNKPLLAAVTGWGQGPDREQARDAGFGMHLVKPVSEAGLKSVLDAASLRVQEQPDD